MDLNSELVNTSLLVNCSVLKYTDESKEDYYIIEYFPIQIKTLTNSQGFFWMSLISVKAKV